MNEKLNQLDSDAKETEKSITEKVDEKLTEWKKEQPVQKVPQEQRVLLKSLNSQRFRLHLILLSQTLIEYFYSVRMSKESKVKIDKVLEKTLHQSTFHKKLSE